MAHCPITHWFRRAGNLVHEVCGGEGEPLGYEVIQSGRVWQVYRCYFCKGRFVDNPRDITEKDKDTLTYLLADL